MHPWVFFQIAVILIVAGSGSYKWLAAVMAIWIGYVTVPLWLASIQIVSAGTGIWLGRQFETDFGRGKRIRCPSCFKRGLAMRENYKLPKTVSCSCGHTIPLDISCWYFRCGCGNLGCLSDEWAMDVPQEGFIVECGNCTGKFPLIPKYKQTVTPSWTLETAPWNIRIGLFNSRWMKARRNLRTFNKGLSSEKGA